MTEPTEHVEPTEAAGPPTPADLAARYLAIVAAGKHPDADEMASALPDETSRRAFHELVESASRLQGLMPVQVRPGAMLGGRYRIDRELGAGGMGKVFEALDTQLKRPVAVKVLAVFGSKRFDPEARFRREAEALAALQHPNIVAIHEVGTDGDVNYLVMDLVRGAPLDRALKLVKQHCGDDPPRRGEELTRALPAPGDGTTRSLIELGSWFRTVARVASEIAHTLEAAHTKGLVHRDIKPGNIMLRPDGSPLVLDFGLAGAQQDETGTVTEGLFGSVAYMAPEQIASGRVGTDPRTDVYQLGAVLYELLTLRRAIEGDTVADLLERIRLGLFAHPRELDDEVPMELEAICLTAMERDPQHRYQSTRELAEDLDRYLEGRVVPEAVVRRRGVAARSRSVKYALRRHRVATALVVMLVLATLVGGVTWWLRPELPELARFFRFTPDSDVDDEDADAVMQAVASGRGRTVFWDTDPSVGRNDLLGVTLELPAPRFVYCLSVFGERDPPTWVVPVEPFPTNAPDLERGDWRVPVFEGMPNLVCSQIRSVSDDVPYEGLRIYLAEEPNPTLETWFDELDWRDDGEGVLFTEALDLLAQIRDGRLASRGGGAPALDLDMMRALSESIETARAQPGSAAWPDLGLEAHTVFFEVRAP
jgi:tRNA A-37 threonylcarbamoyl transferase component Bud32